MEGQEQRQPEGAEGDNLFAPPKADVSEDRPAGGTLVPATRGQRLGAVVLDVLPVAAAAFVAGFALAVIRFAHGHAAVADGFELGMVAAVLVVVGFYAWTAVLVYRYGQSLGKRMVGIRVVRMDGSRANFGRIVFLRNGAMWLLRALPFLGVAIGVLDALWIFGASRRCLHDLVADTQVVTAASSEHATLAGTRPRPFAPAPIFDTRSSAP